MLKKVRGEVNPSDLLTKFLGSKDKVDQLIDLFGCVFMSGRARSAPQLKKKTSPPDDLPETNDELEVNVLDDIDDEGVVAVPEAAFHDINIWPHLYPEQLQAQMFPTATAAPEVIGEDFGECDDLGKLHRRWAATRISITRG